MTLYDFVTILNSSKMPRFQYEGQFFLGKTLVVKKINGNIVVSNTPYMEEKNDN